MGNRTDCGYEEHKWSNQSSVRDSESSTESRRNPQYTTVSQQTRPAVARRLCVPQKQTTHPANSSPFSFFCLVCLVSSQYIRPISCHSCRPKLPQWKQVIFCCSLPPPVYFVQYTSPARNSTSTSLASHSPIASSTNAALSLLVLVLQHLHCFQTHAVTVTAPNSAQKLTFHKHN